MTQSSLAVDLNECDVKYDDGYLCGVLSSADHILRGSSCMGCFRDYFKVISLGWQGYHLGCHPNLYGSHFPVYPYQAKETSATATAWGLN